MKELKKRYDKDPKGWQVFAGKDRGGRYDMFISHRSTLWQIKMEKVRPFQYVGYGVEIGRIGYEVKDMAKLGRPLHFELLSPQRDGSLIIARGIERYSSRLTSDLKGLISERQRKLDLELAEELDRLLYKRFPERLMYV